MPEGDTVHRVAAHLRQELTGAGDDPAAVGRPGLPPPQVRRPE
jgi:hypothetical protein